MDAGKIKRFVGALLTFGRGKKGVKGFRPPIHFQLSVAARKLKKNNK